MTETTVVILNYNGESLLGQFMPSVTAHSAEADLVVADNGSTDNSVLLLHSKHPSVKIISLDRNYGFAGGYNRVLESIDTPFVVLLNSDVEVTPGWLAPLVRILEKDDTIAAAQPRILSYHDRKRFEYAGAAGGFIDLLGYPFCRGRIFDYTETDEGQYNTDSEIFWASGACMILRRQVFSDLGGFDEQFFAHMEEIDLCWRMHRAGHKVAYCAASSVYHVGGATLGKNDPRKTFLNFRNGLWLVLRHWSPVELIWKLPLRALLDTAAWWRFIFGGHLRSALAVSRAYLDFLVTLPATMRKRRKMQKSLAGYSSANVYRKLIAFEYFVKGKRRVFAD